MKESVNPYALGRFIWETIMNPQEPPKTTKIPVAAIHRELHEAIDASDDTADQPTCIGKDGKVEPPAPKDAADPGYFKTKDLKDCTIRFLPPMEGKSELSRKLDLLYGPVATGKSENFSYIEKMLQHNKAVQAAKNDLLLVGFIEEQVEYIRKAIAKKNSVKMAAYKRQFTALYKDFSPEEGWPIRIEEKWKKICDAFQGTNPLEPKEYYHIFDNGNIHLLEATEARKKMMAMSAEMADLMEMPKGVKVTCVKPGPGEPMKKMYGVAEGVEPTFQTHYRRLVNLAQNTLENPATLEYMNALRNGEIKEHNLYNVGDHVEILEGEHKGKVGQIAQIDNPYGPDKPNIRYVEGKARFFIKLCLEPGDVTCHQCQVTKLPVAGDFQRYDRVLLRFGSSQGRYGTVVNIGKCGYGGRNDPWVFVMLDGQHDAHPCGFDAFKLAIESRPTSMPKLNEEVIYYADGLEFNNRRGIVEKEFDNGSIYIKFSDFNPDHGGYQGVKVVLGDITRLVKWNLGKEEPKPHTGFPVFDEFLKNKPEAAGCMYDILTGPVVHRYSLSMSRPNNETLAEQADWENFFTAKRSDRTETRKLLCERIDAAIKKGEFHQIVTLWIEDYEYLVAERKYAPFLDRHTARKIGPYKVALEPVITTKVPEHYPHKEGEVQRVLLVDEEQVKMNRAAVEAVLARHGQSTMNVEGLNAKEIERPGPVTVDTRGFDPNGGTVVLKGKCICDIAVLSVAGCKCGQPVVPEVKKVEEGGCTCPSSQLFFGDGHLPGCPHKK